MMIITFIEDVKVMLGKVIARALSKSPIRRTCTNRPMDDTPTNSIVGCTNRCHVIQADCDADTLLARVGQKGTPVIGELSCFNDIVYNSLDNVMAIYPD